VKLSIVIVNYNVRHFLEQCLQSVCKAVSRIDSEIFVVDNNSVDGSMVMVRSKFPQVNCIINTENVGFAKANNQAIRQAKGAYILLLNPDTVVQEDTFEKCIAFMDSHQHAGGMGVKMIDGKGNYLPESKRGLPTPMVAFYKLSGLIKLFPKSKRFGRYYMGHLSENRTNEVEILAGAFMLLRKKVLDEVGLLDEEYFMYGEDIDLSYRIVKGGYSNIYFADTQIIHYKGESTKKGSLNYVFIFYQAMQIFAKKHFSSGQARLYTTLINFAIWLRAGLSVAKRMVKAIAFPAVDAGLIIGGMYYLKLYWENNHRFVQGGSYPHEFMLYAVPAYVLIWLLSVFFSGGYDKPTRSWHIWRGLAVGTLIILAAYGLLSEQYRFSRALILLGAIWSMIALPAWRWFVQIITKKPMLLEASTHKRRVIVGSQAEYQRIDELLKNSGLQAGFTGWIASGGLTGNVALGGLSQLPEIMNIYRIDEVIFCAKDLSSQDIMEHMSRIQPKQVEIKIAPPESMFVIGSNSINTQGEWYTVQVNTIALPANKRIKRLLDVVSSLVFLLLSPLLILFQKRPVSFLVNSVQVLVGKKTWVGYHPEGKPENLPEIRNGVLTANFQTRSPIADEATLARINFLYAKEYRPNLDLEIILKNMRLLGS
jgi:GT2 family glycosyltransferase